MKNKELLNHLWYFDIAKGALPSLPEDYIQCKDINNFLSIDLQNQNITQVKGIEYLCKESNILYSKYISERQIDRFSNNRLILLKKYISQGCIFIKRIPLFITLQSNSEISNDLFIARFKGFVIKAKNSNKIRVKEGARAYDFKFNYKEYTIHVLKTTGKSSLIFHHIVDGVYNRTKDDIWYVIEHIIAATKV